MPVSVVKVVLLVIFRGFVSKLSKSPVSLFLPSGKKRKKNLVTGSTNSFGDEQLQVDMACDDLIFQRLAACPACCGASSEERPEMRVLPGSGYTVVFDPLDGSSIVGANFAVGSIFGVWPGLGVEGRCGAEQAAAAYAVYGPRTLLVWARPRAGPESPLVVQQLVLGSSGSWQRLPHPRRLPPHHSSPGPPPASSSSSSSGPQPGEGEDAGPGPAGGAGDRIKAAVQGGGSSWIGCGKKLFAPANLRCCAGNRLYWQLVEDWVAAGYTLRYTGGMVPDVHHILAKGGGVFVSPSSAAAPPKLRLVYECAPLALIVEAAGGASSHDGESSVLSARITSCQQRCPIVLGAQDLVEASRAALRASTP